MLNINLISNSVFGSNTYILSHSNYDSVWIIDPGDIDKIKGYLLEIGKCKCCGILLTHTHFDHIYGINAMVDLFPNVRIYTSNNMAIDSLIDAKKNRSKYTDTPFIVNDISNVVVLEDNKCELTLWPSVNIEYKKVLGHSLDSVIYYLQQYLFTGDSFIPNIRTVSKLKGGNPDEANNTIDFIVGNFSPLTIICPGHKGMVMLSDVNINLMKYKKIVRIFRS